ncbi:MAG: MFS transporter, partial [Bacteroidaceae bacterium]|nr:MFS transporter [Bacteroidaceae bacterium]
EGVVPDSVIWSFYIGAAILILCVIYTTMKVKEWNPEEYAMYNGISTVNSQQSTVFQLLKNAPKAFWQVGLVQFFCWAAFMYMWSYTNGAVSETVWGTTDAKSAAYQEAGNWVGILYAVQAVGAVIWAAILPNIKNTKFGYSLSLIIGGLGFALVPFCSADLFGLETAKYVQFIPFLMIGCAWAGMLAMPFTLITNALQGYGHMGEYLGLFNGTICLPQIVAAVAGGFILSLVGSSQPNMMIVAGVLLFCGAAAVFAIKEKNS